MFARVFTLIVTLALVAPIVSAVPTFDNSCNTGTIKCCESMTDAHNQAVQSAAEALGIPISSLALPIGVQCNPISAVIGLGGNRCSSQPACCSDVHLNGGFNLACNPININA